ncbi:MAG: sulfatase-like hydrolase/transferase [bacterium]|nr:sulfatase-like hydrolase/transferase [bacterium]
MSTRFRSFVPYLHLLLLSCLAFAQQLLDLLARNPEFFVIRGSQPVDLIALVVVLLLIPPLPLLLLTWIASRIGGAVETITHRALVALPAALIALQVLQKLGIDTAAWLLAAAVGSALAWLYHRWDPMKVFLTYLTPAILVVPLLFFSGADIRRLMRGPSSAFDLHRSGAEAPIFLLIFDEFLLTSILDAGHDVDAARYPNLAAFAARATWFKNATTVSDATQIAVPAILTGRLPRPGQLPTLEEHDRNLFTLFGGDYAIYAREPITRLCPPEINRRSREPTPFSARLTSLVSDLGVVWLHLVVPGSSAEKLPQVSHTWQGFLTGAAPPPAPAPGNAAAPRTAAQFFRAALDALRTESRDQEFRSFIDAIGPETRRVLHFGHFMLPHLPWEYLPSGARYPGQQGRIPGLRKERWAEESWPATQGLQRYLLQVEFLDRLLGELFDRLDQLDLFDRSLIVLVADHGTSFRPGDNRRAFSDTNAADIAPVPLFIKAPGQTEAIVIEAPVTTLDILPTMLDILSLEPPWPLDGASGLAAHPEPRPIPFLAKHREEQILDPSLHREKYATLDWKLSLVGPSSDPFALFRVGPHPQLVGQRLSEQPRVRPGRSIVKVDGRHLYDDVDLRSPALPALLTGTIEMAERESPCCELAVAINGTISATVPTYGARERRHRFTALVPETAFRAGGNHLEVLVIRERDGGRELETTEERRRSTYALREGADQQVEAIVVDGVEYPVGKELEGWIDSTSGGEETVTVNGWAADRARFCPADEIVVFLDGGFLHAGGISLARESVVKHYGDDRFLESGFSFQLAREKLPGLESSGLRVFALSAARTAGELGVLCQGLKRAADGSEYVAFTNGRRLPLVPGALAGGIEVLGDEQIGMLTVGGWAFDRKLRRPPEKIIGFVDGKHYTQFRTTMRCPEVATRLGIPKRRRCGFRIRVPVRMRSHLEAGRMRLVAISRTGVASELRLLEAGNDRAP